MNETTTIRVSKNTMEMLEKLRNKLKTRSLDETLRTLIIRQRKMLINQVFGLDKDRIKPFTEEDRGENRD
ncbi:MAG: VapB-type antitoxin [Candidatus Bathyarchaeia archaeon]|nr:VapB-type antitoxin [Candidatus Bathyarchaeia archaeon]